MRGETEFLLKIKPLPPEEKWGWWFNPVVAVLAVCVVIAGLWLREPHQVNELLMSNHDYIWYFTVWTMMFTLPGSLLYLLVGWLTASLLKNKARVYTYRKLTATVGVFTFGTAVALPTIMAILLDLFSSLYWHLWIVMAVIVCCLLVLAYYGERILQKEHFTWILTNHQAVFWLGALTFVTIAFINRPDYWLNKEYAPWIINEFMDVVIKLFVESAVIATIFYSIPAVIIVGFAVAILSDYASEEEIQKTAWYAALSPVITALGIPVVIVTLLYMMIDGN